MQRLLKDCFKEAETDEMRRHWLFSRLPKDEGDNRNATQKLKTCVDPSLVPSTPKDKLKLKDDVDIATETIHPLSQAILRHIAA